MAIPRLPIETTFADVYLWKKRDDGKYYITMVNSLNSTDPNSPAHLEIRLLYGGAVHDQRYIVSVPPELGDRLGWYTVLRYNMTGRDNRLNRVRRVWHDYKFLPLVGPWRGRPIRDFRRSDQGSADQHEHNSDDVRQLSSNGLGTV